jgi:hypothetical protein
MADEAGKNSNTSRPIGKRHELHIGIQQARRVSLSMTWMRAIVDRVVARLRSGAPRQYDHDRIIGVAKALILIGVDVQFGWFVERVRNECDRLGIETPRRSQMRKICRPIWDNARAQLAKKN